MKRSILSRLKNDLWVIVMDIIAVNAAFILALLLRYYVHSEFKTSALSFVDTYMRFAPFYTILCLGVFFICGLYDGIWRYAGLSDMNRIIIASVITTVLNIAGTKLFFGDMPKSYYLVGGALQFLMIVAIRFSYRFFLERKQQSDRIRSWTIPVMIVGTGETGRQFMKYLEENTPFQVAVIAGESGGRLLNGVPIVDYSSISGQLQFHGVETVFLADERLSEEQKSEIKKAIESVGGHIIVKDYMDYLCDLSMSLPLGVMLQYMDGPLTVSADGKERQYISSIEAATELDGKRSVKRITEAKIELREV